MENQLLTPHSTTPPEPVMGKDTGKDNAPELSRDELVLLLRSTLRECSKLQAEAAALALSNDSAGRRIAHLEQQIWMLHQKAKTTVDVWKQPGERLDAI